MNQKALADRYQDLRANKHLTIAKLARKIRCNPSTISLYELGEREMPRGVLVKYADFFNVNIEYLLGRTDDPAPQSTAVDDLKLSPKAVEVIKEYSLATNYACETLFNALLTHKEFKNIAIAMSSLLQWLDRAEQGTLVESDLFRISNIYYPGNLSDILDDEETTKREEAEKPSDNFIKQFGTMSAVVGGETLLEFEAFRARKAFDAILQSIINKILNRLNQEADPENT